MKKKKHPPMPHFVTSGSSFRIGTMVLVYSLQSTSYLAVHQLGLHVHGLLGHPQGDIQAGLCAQEPVVQLVGLTAEPLQGLLLPLLLKLVIQLLLRNQTKCEIPGPGPVLQDLIQQRKGSKSCLHITSVRKASRKTMLRSHPG